MDFLHMVGEFNLLTELPSHARKAERDYWFRRAEENYERIAYVYRIDKQGNVITPYLAKLFADDDLMDCLRDDFGGSDFRVMIREGRKLVFSGEIAICPRPNCNLGNDYQ